MSDIIPSNHDTERGNTHVDVETMTCSTQQSVLSDDSSFIFVESKKKLLSAIGLYSPGSGEICTHNITMSDTSILKHPLYPYPAVNDPGITKALLSPEKPLIYEDDGRELYLAVCTEMDICPIRMFQRDLLCQEINLSYYGVDSRGIRAISMALQYNRYVRRLNLTDNFLTDDACHHLNQLLQSNTVIQELILAGCRIGASGTKCLMNNLYVNRTLNLLNLSRNKIGEDGGVIIAKEIDSGCSIKRLNLSDNQLARETALALAEALLYKNLITNFDLSRNAFFHVPSTVKMLNELAGSEHLQELNLSWNALGSERIGGIIKNIMLVPNLMILDLSHNQFQDLAVTLIASSLMQAKKLVTLDLSFNPLKPGDAYGLLQKMLRPRVKLVNLLMEDVNVGKEFLVLLAKVRKMKTRQNFVIKYGRVVKNWIIQGPDPRELILRRAYYLGNLRKKNKVDIALYFLKLSKLFPPPVNVKEFIERIEYDDVPLDVNLVNEIANVFPGKKFGKYQTVNLPAICDYVNRLWPEKKLPPTPPPAEPEENIILPQTTEKLVNDKNNKK